MKLEEGMYVRTKKGNIGKITFISPLDSLINLDTENYSIGKHFIKGEPSHNIIDLIEVGDYVNGNRIDQIDKFKDGSVYLQFEDGNYYCKNYQIQSIVTKEQFESMSYRLGD